MNRLGALLLLLIAALAGCASSGNGESAPEYLKERSKIRVPVLRIVYSANTNGRFQPEAG